MVKQFLANLVTTAVFVGVVLVSAGSFTYVQAWIYGGIGLLMNAGMRIVLRGSGGLAKERARPGPGARPWDKALLGVGFLLTLAALLAAGFQARRPGGPPQVSFGPLALGVGLSLGGMLLFLSAMRENAFFGSVVRAQTERGHEVCTTGPYRFVRHPGNLGMIVGMIGLPFLLQSTWAIPPMAASVALMVVRTHLEDAFLAAELKGYGAYRQATRFRLIPGVW